MNGGNGEDIKRLFDKIKSIEEMLKEFSSQKVEYHITIQNVNVHDPVLKELSFSLEKLDIKELSGALNMGNNFGPKVEQRPKQEKKKVVDKQREVKEVHRTEKQPKDIIIKINNVPQKYSIK